MFGAQHTSGNSLFVAVDGSRDIASGRRTFGLFRYRKGFSKTAVDMLLVSLFLNTQKRGIYQKISRPRKQMVYMYALQRRWSGVSSGREEPRTCTSRLPFMWNVLVLCYDTFNFLDKEERIMLFLCSDFGSLEIKCGERSTELLHKTTLWTSTHKITYCLL
jgi:hypothetical protein